MAFDHTSAELKSRLDSLAEVCPGLQAQIPEMLGRLADFFREISQRPCPRCGETMQRLPDPGLVHYRCENCGAQWTTDPEWPGVDQ